tara:strand:+ start:1188 stop:3857 length:2670 start_codon:yes stop_codon:yes gene_type:complete
MRKNTANHFVADKETEHLHSSMPDCVPETMSSMRQFIRAHNLDISTVGAGRTKAAVRDEIVAQLAVRDEIVAQLAERRVRPRTIDTVDVSGIKTQSPKASAASVYTHVRDVKRCLESEGALIGAESVANLNRLTERRAQVIVEAFQRMRGWRDSKTIRHKFALYIRGAIRFPLRDVDVVPLIPPNVVEAPSSLERFACTLRDIDDLFRRNDWWRLADTSRTTYHLNRLLRREIASKKNTCVSKKAVLSFCLDHEIRESEAAACITTMIKEGTLISFEDERFISTRTYFTCEQTVFDAFNFGGEAPLDCPYTLDPSRRTPTEEQRGAIEGFAKYTLLLLTGPGGCGKSDVCLREIMHLAFRNRLPVTFLGFTHVVRKLLGNFVDESVEDVVHAQTLASLLKEPTGAEAGAYILDEASMVDSIDMSKLLARASKDGSRIVLCGDPDQLRPIGAGSPFADLVAHCRRCGDARLCELTRVFRAESAELTSFANIYRSHKIADDMGEFWSFKTASRNNIQPRYKDVVGTYFTENDDAVVRRFKEACEEYKKRGAMERRILCVAAKNDMCVHLHKVKREVFRGVACELALSHGDQCIFKKNSNYFKNGDAGYIHELYTHPSVARGCRYYTVLYIPDEEEVERLRHELKKPAYDRCNLDVEFLHTQPQPQPDGVWLICVPEDSLSVGGCVTVHKAQGRGEDYCIVTATNESMHMSRSDWAYTGVSRAKQGVSLVGALNVFNQHARPRENPPRDTILHRLLKDEVPQPLPPPETTPEMQTIASQLFGDLHEESRTEVEAGKTRRLKIRKAVRDAVWRRDCHKTPDGQCLMTASCCCCSIEIDKDHFHCAHIVSVFDGGTDAVENLKLCCSTCNESMGTMNLLAFQALFPRHECGNAR